MCEQPEGHTGPFIKHSISLLPTFKTLYQISFRIFKSTLTCPIYLAPKTHSLHSFYSLHFALFKIQTMIFSSAVTESECFI